MSFIKLILSLSLMSLLFSCVEKHAPPDQHPLKFEMHSINGAVPDSLETGQTYLSVYSEIYSINQHQTHDLTVTISLRNTSQSDTLFIVQATYFDTKGKSIRSYFATPIFLTPLETVEIIIDEAKQEGGTGGNFIFDWKKTPLSSDPIFEAVMISTSGQQGLSFATQGKRLK